MMRSSVKTALSFSAILALSVFALAAAGQQPKSAPAVPASAAPSQTQKNVEAYLRHLYAFGPDVQVVVGPLKESPVEGLLETNIDVTIGENKEAVKFYVSKDGKFLFRGDLSDLAKDPLAETRAQIQMNDAPSMGDPNAPVTLVEYSDFECPVCKSLHDVVRGILTDYAGQAGVNAGTFKSCMASPEPGAAVNASRANGQQLEVNSTPTVFVNGRRLVGADARLLEQYINYELAQQKFGKPADKK